VTLGDPRPVLFVTNLVAPDRVGAFRALHAEVGIELALFGGRSHHATGDVADPGVPTRRVPQRAVHALASSGAHRAVVAGTAGRVALPAAWTGARRAGVPFVLWSALWAHPRTAAHAAGTALLRAIYRDAHAVVAYGPHVAAFAARHGARRVEIAPQAVDGDFWSRAPAVQPPAAASAAAFTAVFVGRDEPAKGLDVLEEAWRRTGFAAPAERLVLVGVEGRPGAVGPRTPEEVRNFLGSADVLVVPSRRTRTFREPWGLVCNEAMHAGTPVIATDEVGAAAGGLVRDARNGLVVPSADPGAIAGALRRLRADPALRARLGAAAREDVAPYTFEAWAAGFARALA
jgi:glycosyltransferase involved in cell wall biosynthesis